MISYETFLNQYTKKRKDGSVRILCDYKNKFGEMSFEEAYASEVNRINKISEFYKKIDAFEKFLLTLQLTLF